jgi:hypothetical protein
MGFGSSTPATPKPQPVTPVPQEDDPKSLEARKVAAAAAQRQEGMSAHLLSGEKGIEDDPEASKKKLFGTSATSTV